MDKLGFQEEDQLMGQNAKSPFDAPDSFETLNAAGQNAPPSIFQSEQFLEQLGPVMTNQSNSLITPGQFAGPAVDPLDSQGTHYSGGLG
jgi:hypothetical protein